jgi:hypothetical protein
LDRLRTGNAFGTIDRFIENVADYTSEFCVPRLVLLLVFVKVHRSSAQNPEFIGVISKWGALPLGLPIGAK